MDEVNNVTDICGLDALFRAFPEPDAGADGGADVGGCEEGFVVLTEVSRGVTELDAEEG